MIVRAEVPSSSLISRGRSIMRRPPIGAAAGLPACRMAVDKRNAPVARGECSRWVTRAERARGGFRPRARLPSAPVVGSRQREALREGVVAREETVGERDLPPARYAELLAQHVAMRLGRARRDAELLAELLVGQTLCDQPDHLQLARGDRFMISECLHGREATAAVQMRPLTKGRISG